MNSTVAVLLTIASIIGAAIWFFRSYLPKKDRAEAQARKDANIEKFLMDSFSEHDIAFVAEHSDKERMAAIIAHRFCDLLKAVSHPEAIVSIASKYGLYGSIRINATNREIELSALAQNIILRNIDSHDLQAWQMSFLRPTLAAQNNLNKSFLAKVEKNTVVWDLKLN